MASVPRTFDSPPPPRAALLISLVAGLAAAALVLVLVRNPVIAGGFLGASVVLGGAVLVWAWVMSRTRAPTAPLVDWDVVRALAAESADAIAVTDRAGKLVCANDRYRELFGGLPTPPGMPLGDAGVALLSAAGRSAWRDGRSAEAGLRGTGP